MSMLHAVGSLFGSASKLVGIGLPCDDGIIDRLSHNWTTFLLTLFALAVTTKQFAGSPINCFIGDKNGDIGYRVDYIHSLCWVNNTYDVPFDEILPVEAKERKQRELKYYQWVPIILLMQALMFKAPNMIWKMCNSTVGLNLQKIMSLAQSTQYDLPSKRDETIKNIAAYIHSWLLFERERHYTVYSRIRNRMSRLSIFCFPLGYRNGTYLVGLYCFCKLLYLLNSIVQFFILNELMGFDYQTYGSLILKDLIEEGVVDESPAFPRIAYCDVFIRQQNNVLPYSYQCVLSINMLSEKVFAVLWFWILFVAVATGLSLLKWAYSIVFRRNRLRYVEKYLASFVNIAEDQELCHKFIDEYLRDDGVLVLRSVSNNSSLMVLADLVKELWKLYNKHRQVRYEIKEQRKQEFEKRKEMEMEVLADENGGTKTRLRKMYPTDI